MNSRYASLSDLTRFATDALRAVGIAEDDARLTARSLVQADQRGIHSHGLLRLALYVDAITHGGINAKPALRWTADTGSAALLDADGALGQVAMAATVNYALEHTRDRGVSVVSVQNSSHYGAGAFWTDQLTAVGFLAVLTSTTGPVVAPFGGITKVLGTNPLTIAIPSAGSHALTADLATSTGAYGKVISARNEGVPIPKGWAVDSSGMPTIDPSEAMEGALTAFGGHKGSAVSALVEALSASLGTGNYAHETEDIWSNPGSRMNTGHLLIAIDSEAFTTRAHTESRVRHLQNAIRNSGTTVLAPGDPEQATAAENAESILLARSTSQQLDELAKRLTLVPLP